MANKKIQHLHFDSIIELSDYLESNWHHWEKSNKSGVSFSGLLSQDECRAILKNGGDHQPSADRMQRAELDMSKIPAGDLELPQLANAPYGHRPNVGAYLAGSPYSMVRFEPQPQPNKSVRMYYNLAASASVDSQSLAYVGASILGAIDALQVDGYAVELTIAMLIRTSDGDNFHATIKVKDFGDTWNPAAIAFMLAEPSFFRRSLFALINIEQVKDPKSIAAELGYGLGRPVDKTDDMGYDIQFDGILSEDDIKPDDALERVMSRVYEWLETNKAGAAA